VTALTGRAIGAWVVSLGVAAAHAVVEGDAERVRPAAVADVAFALLQGVALARHGDALDAGAASTWVYATVLAAMAVIGVAALAGGRAG
jgi:hypothetical protein